MQASKCVYEWGTIYQQKVHKRNTFSVQNGIDYEWSPNFSLGIVERAKRERA